jgi:hypothetical protein
MADSTHDEADLSLFARGWSGVKTLLSILTDLSFKRFVTPRLIKLIYILSLIAAALSALAWMASGFTEGIMRGCFTVATGPIAFFFYMLTARVGCEFMLAVFQIAENTARVKQERASEHK